MISIMYIYIYICIEREKSWSISWICGEGFVGEHIIVVIISLSLVLLYVLSVVVVVVAVAVVVVEVAVVHLVDLRGGFVLFGDSRHIDKCNIV